MVESIEEVHWLELGLPEAAWILRVRDFGPLVVGADTKGNSHFDAINRHIDSRVTEIYRKLGIEGLEFAEK
jgi:tartrate dehydratase beta subunit/fumarate hydratase class I family protein